MCQYVEFCANRLLRELGCSNHVSLCCEAHWCCFDIYSYKLTYFEPPNSTYEMGKQQRTHLPLWRWFPFKARQTFLKNV
jgi:hypothetical protein